MLSFTSTLRTARRGNEPQRPVSIRPSSERNLVVEAGARRPAAIHGGGIRIDARHPVFIGVFATLVLFDADANEALLELQHLKIGDLAGEPARETHVLEHAATDPLRLFARVRDKNGLEHNPVLILTVHDAPLEIHSLAAT